MCLLRETHTEKRKSNPDAIKPGDPVFITNRLRNLSKLIWKEEKKKMSQWTTTCHKPGDLSMIPHDGRPQWASPHVHYPLATGDHCVAMAVLELSI